MVRAAEALARQPLVDLAVEMAVAEKQQLGAAPYLRLAQEQGGGGRDSQVDPSCHAAYA